MTSSSIFYAAFWVLLGGVLLMRLYFTLRVRRAGERFLPDQKAIQRTGKVLFAFQFGSWLAMIVIVVSYALNPTWLDVARFALSDWLRWVGFVIGVISALFWTWTQAILGIEWSPQLQVRAEHHLITSGPYAHIRHPMYICISGFWVGLALVSANWIFVVLAALLIMGLAFRIPREEKMLIEKFGEEYRTYMRHTV